MLGWRGSTLSTPLRIDPGLAGRSQARPYTDGARLADRPQACPYAEGTGSTLRSEVCTCTGRTCALTQINIWVVLPGSIFSEVIFVSKLELAEMVTQETFT